MKLKFYETYELSEVEIRKAYRLWLTKVCCQDLEQQIQTVFKLNYPVVESWLKFARENSFLSLQTVSNRIGKSKKSISEFEKNETAGTISLNSLRQVAEAMDCELVYFIRPKSKRTFIQTTWQKILPFGLRLPHARNSRTSVKPMALAASLWALMNDPDFRKSQGWSQDRSKSNYS